jgi:hypothetical protein
MKAGTPYVYGHPIAPCAVADAKGNVSIVMVSLQILHRKFLTSSECGIQCSS